jgi:hypothetical protein
VRPRPVAPAQQTDTTNGLIVSDLIPTARNYDSLGIPKSVKL